MKIALYGPQRRVGIIVDDFLFDASYAHAKYVADQTGVSFQQALTAQVVPSQLNEFISAESDTLEKVEQAIEHMSSDPSADALRDIRFKLDEVQLSPPIDGSSRIFAALANFADHMQAAASNTDDASSKETLESLQSGGPKYFIKDARCTSTDGDPVFYPKRTNLMDYEAEVAIIVGKQGRDIQKENYREYVWGFALANDWSIRDNVSFGPDFMHSKNFDTAAGLGPWIVKDDSIDPHNIPVECRINDEVRQSGNTQSMIHDFGDLIQHVSADVTLYPGDIILSGTPKGTAVDSSKRRGDGTFEDNSAFLQPGDLVQVSSELLGSLTNTVTNGD